MREFKAKLLLFGEYGLIKGSKALGVPFKQFTGKLSFEAHPNWEQSNAVIRKYIYHLEAEQTNDKLIHPINFKRIKRDIANNLWFDSNIPQQYGVGSSGALVAAIYDEYSNAQYDFLESPKAEVPSEVLANLKHDFAILESYFHGNSSGIDPLISYIDRPVLIGQKDQLSTIPVEQHQKIRLFLIDTNGTGATGPLVNYFMEMASGSEYLQKLLTHLIPANDFCIEHYLNGNHDSFFFELGKLIDFQLNHLKLMIPSKYRQIIKDCLKKNLFIKLLGSGGGGFLLGFAPNDKSIDDFANRYQVKVIRV